MKIIRYLVSISFVLLVACQVVPEQEMGLITCPEVRPQVCTRIYRPVCALDEQQQFKTYANKCTACAINHVVAYRAGGGCRTGKLIDKSH